MVIRHIPALTPDERVESLLADVGNLRGVVGCRRYPTPYALWWEVVTPR
jgi:hypothetical protein